MSTRKMTGNAVSSRCPSGTNGGSSGGRELGALVNRYISEVCPCRAREWDHYRRQPSLRDAIHVAALAKPGDRRKHPHEDRIPVEKLRSGEGELLEREGPIEGSNTFEAIHNLVGEAAQKFKGLGVLWKYDASLRIGLFRGIMLDRVYLQRGAAKGAKELLLLVNGSLMMDDLPQELRSLEPFVVENFLCVRHKL